MTPTTRFTIACIAFFILLALTFLTGRRGRPLVMLLASALMAIARRLDARMPRLARRLGSAGLGLEHGYMLYRESCEVGHE